MTQISFLCLYFFFLEYVCGDESRFSVSVWMCGCGFSQLWSERETLTMTTCAARKKKKKLIEIGRDNNKEKKMKMEKDKTKKSALCVQSVMQPR